ncbi:hypothetical protein [Caldicellulosiruptor sp. F32]|nr:hypothetical protein [Caldicellulosiruptor sp. F32]
MEKGKIIYAAYGSNLLKERFMVYINGGFKTACSKNLLLSI